MDILARLHDSLTDDRLLANLIGVHALLAGILVVSFIVRKVLLHGGDQLGRWTGMHWMDAVGKEANRRVRSILFWVTLCLLTATIATGIVYHLAGRDLRRDAVEWYAHLTAQQLLALGVTAGKLVGLAVGNLSDAGAVQLALPFDRFAGGALDAAVDDVRERFGSAALTRAVQLGRREGLTVPLLPD